MLKNSSGLRITFAIAAAFMFFQLNVFAKKDEQPKPKAKKSLEDSLKKCRKIEGLFTLFQDTTTGQAFIVIKKEQIDKEFIYFAHTANGVLDAGHFRGSFRDNKIFSVRKYFNKIQFVTENTNFYFDPNSALSRSANANISHSVLFSEKILYQDTSRGIYLVNADNLFLTENFQQVKPTPNPKVAGEMFNLGALNKDKTHYLKLSSYPMNTEVTVEYVYENPNAYVAGGKEVTDNRFVSISIQHSLIEVPKNNFKPRKDDPRVGFFNEQVDDMTSTAAAPYKDVITRWNLVKKDKNAKISEPEKPITWWIENTTPVEFRETIKAAALTWNEAFEKIGFKNVIQVEVQPDNADWDAGDIRYNVLRWTSSPRPPFGGYGPSFENPRTGEILGADIMLEFIFVTNRLKQDKLFSTAALPNFEEQNSHLNPDKHFCSLGEYLHNSTMFGMYALQMENLSEKVKEDYLKQSLYYLVLHEMGHTLGLMHNMKASQMYGLKDINNKELTAKTGLTGSVMDYPAVNLSLDKNKQGLFFTSRPGPYDLWAIEYAYSEGLDDEKAEEERLNKILARSADSTLIFGNDADDMRAPGFGIDPRVMIGDMSNDAVSYSVERFKLCNNLLGKLKKNYTKNGESYHELRNTYLIVTGEYATAARVISRYVGGVYVDRAFAGQNGAKQPFTPVSYTDQKRSMAALNKYVFSPEAFSAGNDLYTYLQMQRRGFNHMGNPEDPKLHDRVLNIQKEILAHILHPNVLERLTDSRLYGNKYTVAEMMGSLTDGIFKEDITTNVNTFRQNLQVEYVNRLAEIVKDGKKYPYTAQSQAHYQLKNIQKMMAANPGTNAETIAHRQFISQIIKNTLENN